MENQKETKENQIEDIEIEELKAWHGRTEYYLVGVFNGEKSLEEFKEDLLSFRNSKFYTGTKDIYKQIYE